MSSHESPTNEHDRPAKRRIQRRHGACEPCRSSKTKCDGRTPCGACRSERRRQCPCVYSEKAMKLQQVTAEIQRRAESEKRHVDDAARSCSDDETRRFPLDMFADSASATVLSDDAADMAFSRLTKEHASVDAEMDSARMVQPLSICAAIEEFKRLKPARGYSAQVVLRCSGFDVVNAHNATHQQRGTDGLHHAITSPIPASNSSNFSQDFIEVLALRARLDAVEMLVREGRPTRAWIDLASIVREAQVIQDEMIQDQSSPTSASWRRLWNDVLDFEARLGLTLGRPTCLVSVKGRRTAGKIDTMALEDSLEDIKIDLYQHIQGLLGLNLSSNTAIRDFLERARDILYHEPFNQIGLCTTEGHSVSVRDVHLNTHLLFMVVFCRMASLCDSFSRDLTNGSWADTPAADIIRSLNLHQPRQKLAYCRKMFRSANFILDSFLGIHRSNPGQIGKNWMRCHNVLIAAMILGIAKLRHEVEWHATTDKLRRLEYAFADLSQNHPQCYLFGAAIERLQDLNSVKEPATEAQLNKHTGVKNRKRAHPNSGSTSPRLAHPPTLSILLESDPTSPILATNNQRDTMDIHPHEDSLLGGPFAQEHTHVEGECQQQVSLDSVYDDPHLNPLSLFEDTSATWSTSSTSFNNPSVGSSTTSFSETELPIQAVSGLAIGHPGPPFAYPFPFQTFHPPMSWNNPAYHINGQIPEALSLQIPLLPPYHPELSPMSGDMGTDFELGDLRNAEPPASASLQSTPSQAPSDLTLVGHGMSPTMQADSRFPSSDAISGGATGSGVGSQAFLQQVTAPLLGNDPSNTLDRPPLDRRNSTDIVQPPSNSGRGDNQHSSVEWHPASSVGVTHDVESSLANNNLSVPDIGRSASGDNSRQAEAPVSRLDQTSYYTHTTIQPSSEILNHQSFPSNQVNYIGSASSLFGQPQILGSYQQGHTMHYPKLFVQDPGQYPDQWRSLTINAGAASGSSY